MEELRTIARLAYMMYTDMHSYIPAVCRIAPGICLPSLQKRIKNHPRCMMKQIIQHVKGYGKYLHAASSIENTEENAARHDLASWRTKIFRIGQKILTQSLF